MALMLLFCFGSISAGDVVFFKDNTKPIEGKVTEKGDKIVVEKADGTTVEFERGEISHIEKGKGLLDMYIEKLAKISAEDLTALFDLAMWCDKVGLTEKRAVLLLEILKRDPDNLDVHTFLGHVYRGGRWVNPTFGEEFGDNIADTLSVGSFIDKAGKYFTVRTDTSPDFAAYVVKHLDLFCEKLEDSLRGELSFKPLNGKPVMLILANYEEYKSVVTGIIDKLLPRDQRPGQPGQPGQPNQPDSTNEHERYVPPPHTCFLDPTGFMLITYRYPKKPNITPLRENVQKLAGYGMYIFGAGGFAGPYKSPRFLIEGFASVVGLAEIVNTKLELAYLPKKLAATRSELTNLTAEYLFKIDPLAYYTDDKTVHSYTSTWFTYFMLSNSAYRDKYFKLIKLDATSSLRIDAFNKTIGKPEQFPKDWTKFCDSAF